MASALHKIGVLFVCTGNICRSPTAEGIFRHSIASNGMDNAFYTGSAGTHDYHVGDAPDPRAVRTALARGVDISSLKAQQVDARDFSRYGWIVAMDRSHLAHLELMKCGTAGLGLLMKFAGDANADVPDPYYGDQSSFTQAYDLIEKGIDGLVSFLRDHPHQ